MRRRRFWRRLAKLIAWGLVLILLIAAGVTWFAYTVVTDSDTAARLIKGQAARFFPRSLIEMGNVSVNILRGGAVEVRKVHLRQRIDGQLFETAWIPWLSVRLDARQVLHGKFEPREVIVSQPTLRLCRRQDGTWNLQGLLADPWPGPVLKNPPPIIIRNGTVELFGVDDPDADPTTPASSGARTASAGRPKRDGRVVRSGRRSAARRNPRPCPRPRRSRTFPRSRRIRPPRRPGSGSRPGAGQSRRGHSSRRLAADRRRSERAIAIRGVCSRRPVRKDSVSRARSTPPTAT